MYRIVHSYTVVLPRAAAAHGHYYNNIILYFHYYHHHHHYHTNTRRYYVFMIYFMYLTYYALNVVVICYGKMIITIIRNTETQILKFKRFIVTSTVHISRGFKTILFRKEYCNFRDKYWYETKKSIISYVIFEHLYIYIKFYNFPGT